LVSKWFGSRLLKQIYGKFILIREIQKSIKVSLYVMAIIGVAFVLLILGLIGWFLINAKQLGDYFKENIEVRAHLSQTYTAQDSAALMSFIATQPYVKSYEFITKEKAKTIYEADGNEDWEKILDHNPLPASVNFKIRSEYANPDSLDKVSQTLTTNLYVSDVNYPKSLVANLNNIIRKISIVLLIIAVIICVVVIVLIDNTIRLAMFSNRFLIKTMQMVGATRWFIAKPMDLRAIGNGALSGILTASRCRKVAPLPKGAGHAASHFGNNAVWEIPVQTKSAA